MNKLTKSKITVSLLFLSILAWLAVVCTIPYDSDKCIVIKSSEPSCYAQNNGEEDRWIECLSNIVVLSRNVTHDFTVGCSSTWCSYCTNGCKEGSIQTCYYTVIDVSLNNVDNLIKMIIVALILTYSAFFTHL